MRVLVVEDDRRLADVVRDSLEEEGMDVDLVADGVSAVRAALALSYDVVLLDVLLGAGIDGFDVCRQLRDRGCHSAVLMLTALDAVPSRVRGLNAGADDYIVKPFAISELIARLHAVVRRGRGAPSAPQHAHGVHLDPLGRRVVVDGSDVPMTRKEFDILKLLMSRIGQVISKEQVMDSVWSEELDASPNLVEVHLARIRRKFSGSSADGCITTIRGVGYRFEADGAA